MSVYSRVDSGVRYRRSPFPIKQRLTYDCNGGQLIPIFRKQMIPTDIFKIGVNALVRFMPMLAPVFTEINMYVHFFFVPFRILAKYFPEKYGHEDDVEAIITGGEGAFDPETGLSDVVSSAFPCHDEITIEKYSFGDYLGFPVGKALHNVPQYWADAAAIIYNEFYRNEVLQEKLTDFNLNSEPFCRNWAKDYFTSSLPTQQKGIAPALPVSGETSAVWDNNIVTGSHNHTTTFTKSEKFSEDMNVPYNNGSNPRGKFLMEVNTQGGTSYIPTTITSVSDNSSITIPKDSLNANVVSLADATTFDVADIRNVFAIQRILERNNRCGSRYSEYIQANFGVNPGDTRLNRPEYVGGCKTPILTTQVVQTSATEVSSPQGNLAGHGIGYIGDKVGTYVAKEFGVMLGFASIMPKASYQQGIDKELMYKDRWDFFNPSFQNLSEQPVYNWELYVNGNMEATETDAGDGSIFGFQGIYNELRSSYSHVVGAFRDSLDFWHLGRKFSERPTLSDAFLTCDPDETTRIFAGTDSRTYKNMLVDLQVNVKSLRPMVKHPVPAYLDHN